jgi:hypothetical protein
VAACVSAAGSVNLTSASTVDEQNHHDDREHGEEDGLCPAVRNAVCGHIPMYSTSESVVDDRAVFSVSIMAQSPVGSCGTGQKPVLPHVHRHCAGFVRMLHSPMSMS